MKRVLKILTLGLEKKRAWQLPIIAGLLVLFGLGVRWWFNSRAAKGIRLLDMVEIGDIEGVRWICRWDREQMNREGEVSKALKKHKKLFTLKYSPLLLAARQGHTEMVTILLDAGAKVNAKCDDAETPLHGAAYLGQTEVVKILLKAKAEVNAASKDGKTPLDKTEHRKAWRDPKKRDECAQLLRTHGAKTSAELDAEAKQGKK